MIVEVKSGWEETVVVGIELAPEAIYDHEYWQPNLLTASQTATSVVLILGSCRV